MGHRLTRIYTRTGDAGTTGLGDGSRVGKDALRVQAYGELDELNSHLGLVLAHRGQGFSACDPCPCLEEIQQQLFDLGGDLCIPGRNSLQQSHVDWLEAWLDELNLHLPPLKEFVLPGGNAAAAQCHVARTVCRRAERTLVALAAVEPIEPIALAYLNRLSDLLFVAARVLARRDGGTEALWQPRRPPAATPR
jgi:cob(I)alamin adenosyltransferase